VADEQERFLGTYFDREGVLRIAKALIVLSWVVAGIYAADFVIGMGVFGLQYARGLLTGLGPTDVMQNVLYILERPIHGILYFAILQVLARGLQIALDVEDNTRRAARR
jgi:hypothetical protein